MKLKLNKKDLKGAFVSNTDCPIARGLKRRGFKYVLVGGDTVSIEWKDYSLGRNASARVRRAQKTNANEATIEIEGLESLSFKQRIINFFK